MKLTDKEVDLPLLNWRSDIDTAILIAADVKTYVNTQIANAKIEWEIL